MSKYPENLTTRAREAKQIKPPRVTKDIFFFYLPKAGQNITTEGRPPKLWRSFNVSRYTYRAARRVGVIQFGQQSMGELL